MFRHIRAILFGGILLAIFYLIGPFRRDIAPFPEFNLNANHVDMGDDLLRVYPVNGDLWNGDVNCTRYHVHLLKSGSQPEPGAFVSFPGSGNSWLRNLLMGITGVYVSTVYKGDSNFRSSANNVSYQIPVDCGCSLLQKTHDLALDGHLQRLHRINQTMTLEHYNSKGVLIIRNPYKAIKSYRNFQFGGMTGLAPESAFQGEQWDEFVRRSVAGWETLATVWIRGLKRGGVVYYERLTHEPRSELERLLKMIGFNSYSQDRFDCVLRHIEDNPKRRTTNNEISYTLGQQMLIRQAMENVQRALRDRGLDPLPTEYY